MYLRIWRSEKPNFDFSQGQKLVVAAVEIRIGLPFMSASELMSRRGWLISTCGSFWNTAITAFSGKFCRAMFSEMKLLEPMPKSAAPDSSNCGTFTSGPPWMMVTSSPRLA